MKCVFNYSHIKAYALNIEEILFYEFIFDKCLESKSIIVDFSKQTFQKQFKIGRRVFERITKFFSDVEVITEVKTNKRIGTDSRYCFHPTIALKRLELIYEDIDVLGHRFNLTELSKIYNSDEWATKALKPPKNVTSSQSTT